MEHRKNDQPGLERRIVPYEKAEVRVREDGTRQIVGHAAVFGHLSEDLGGWREEIMPGAFRDALAASDIRALFNHNPDFVLGRTKSGTLRVSEDERGLYTETDPPDTQMVRDLVLQPMARGDIDQMSFAFRLKGKDSFEWIDDGDEMVRRIKPGGVAEVFDISPVTYAAYPDTTVAVRSLHAILEHDEELRQRHAEAVRRVKQLERQMRLEEIRRDMGVAVL